MAESLADRITQQIAQVAENYYQLLLIVAPSGSGKTAALREVHDRTGLPLINVNLNLSRRMLDLTERQRVLHLPRLLGEMVNAVEGTAVLLDNTEILFDVSLKQDPLRLLEGISRNRTLIVAWNGSVQKHQVTYATPDHLEYKRYSMRDLLVIAPDQASFSSAIPQKGEAS